MRERIIPILALISLVILFFLLNFTTPTTIGPFGVLVFFTTIYTLVFSLVAMGMTWFYRMIKSRKKLRKKDYLYAAVVAFVPIMLLLVQSFQMINVGTIVMMGIFVLLACFLVHKRA